MPISHLPLSRLVQSSTACWASLVVVPILKMPPCTVISSVGGTAGGRVAFTLAVSTVGPSNGVPTTFVGGISCVPMSVPTGVSVVSLPEPDSAWLGPEVLVGLTLNRNVVAVGATVGASAGGFVGEFV